MIQCFLGVAAARNWHKIYVVLVPEPQYWFSFLVTIGTSNSLSYRPTIYTPFDRESSQLQPSCSQAILEITEKFRIKIETCAVRSELCHFTTFFNPFLWVPFRLVSETSESLYVLKVDSSQYFDEKIIWSLKKIAGVKGIWYVIGTKMGSASLRASRGDLVAKTTSKSGLLFSVALATCWSMRFSQQIYPGGHTTLKQAGYFSRHAAPAHNNQLYVWLSQTISRF